jgi:hypothetical protein
MFTVEQTSSLTFSAERYDNYELLIEIFFGKLLYQVSEEYHKCPSCEKLATRLRFEIAMH